MLKNFPKISIILPSYNRVEYLAESIESCLSQTFKDFELVIVDDNSTDSSYEVALGYSKKDSRVKVIKNKENKKLPASLNIGFKEAAGEYLTWTSDDNLYAPEALEKMKCILDARKEIGLVYADYTIIDEESRRGARIYQEPPEFLPIWNCVGCCFLYRASVAVQVGIYNESKFLVEDYEYWLRMGLVTKLFHIKESLYFYRKHRKSLTFTKKEEASRAQIELKQIFAGKYLLSKKIKPISDLYDWLIGERNFKSYLKPIKIILSNPIATLSYVLKNLNRP